MFQEVPGIAFLSGGQSEIEATKNLNEINKNDTNFLITFSYGTSTSTKCFENLVKRDEKDMIKFRRFLTTEQ